MWHQFLSLRRELINQWRREGKSCTEIAYTLSMDAGQVYLISQVESGPVPDDAQKSITEHSAKMQKMIDEGKW